ncbi:hypothetical protein HNP87_001450 [Methanococcus maripaludis]|uniref:DUF6884 domain-containing protein n=1 Tax=Methanococcus maripaludis TaxID=39152 RepID=A0A7J9NJ27_METMI|nr:DUF6884 domain-containing protein [Methanococcus maripaludis]MBA2840918.1 hypothetical protein [Methanococcus maripaludis]
MPKNDNIVIITACGNSKEEVSKKAGNLYKSSRIRHLYNRSKELGVPLYILSAKYGLVNSEEIIEPYDEVMTKEKALELKSSVKETLEEFEYAILYEGGARIEYRDLIYDIAEELGLKLIKFGYKNMGDIGKLDGILTGVYDAITNQRNVGEI